jgi:hypothetical protein
MTGTARDVVIAGTRIPAAAIIAKVVVTFERRDDGGLRAYSEDVPGFVLSHRDPSAVIRDVAPALERILSAMWGVKCRLLLCAELS